MDGFAIEAARVAVAPASDVHWSEAWEGGKVVLLCVLQGERGLALGVVNAVTDIQVLYGFMPNWGLVF